jgi:hypothetical protein
MAALAPIFHGSYAGHMIYNATRFEVGDNFKRYVESLEMRYEIVYDRRNTGFAATKYTLNETIGVKTPITIAITLVGDLPHWLMQQLTQLAKATLGGGMTIQFTDDWATYNSYLGKWENAGDFVENNELLAGGSMLLKCWHIIGTGELYTYDGLGDIYTIEDTDYVTIGNLRYV